MPSRPQLGPPPGHRIDLSAEVTKATLYIQNMTLGSKTGDFLTSRHTVQSSAASLMFIHRPDPRLPSSSKERQTELSMENGRASSNQCWVSPGSPALPHNPRPSYP